MDVKLEIDAIRAMEERKGGRKEEKKKCDESNVYEIVSCLMVERTSYRGR